MFNKNTVKISFVHFGMTAVLLIGPVVSVEAVTKPATTSALLVQTQQQRMDNLKARAGNEINRRVTALSDLVSRLNAIKHLSADSKTTFVNSIKNEITSLNTLKTKVDADTDLNTLKTDVQSIVNNYRVFLVYIPQIQLLAAADRLSDVSGKLADLATKLQTRLNNAQASGKDVSSLETLLKAMTTKIADANTQYNNVESSVIPLTPNGYPGNRATLIASRKMIQTGHQDLVAALQDAQKIIQGLKSLGNNTSTSSATSH